MTDNIVRFPGTEDQQGKEERSTTPETILAAASERYDELILIGRTKDTRRYEVVSTLEIPETLYHVVRIQHRLQLFLDGN